MGFFSSPFFNLAIPHRGSSLTDLDCQGFCASPWCNGRAVSGAYLLCPARRSAKASASPAKMGLTVPSGR
eukprot:5210556-Alexandrium_andersonii.AAC.1